MANKKEITATEKLLDLIRTGSRSETTVLEPPTVHEQDHLGSPPETIDESDLQIEISMVEKSIEPNNLSSPRESYQIDQKSAESHPQVQEDVPSANSTSLEDDSPTIQNENDYSNWTWYETKQNNKFPSCLTNLFRRTKIGIDIHPGSVHIVKAEITKSKRNLLACESYSYEQPDENAKPTDLSQNLSLKTLLSQKLSSLCTCELRRPELWCTYAFANPVSIYNITIPIVSSKDLPATVYWTIKKEGFDEKESIIDFTIFKEVEVKGQKKLQVIVTIIPKKESNAIKNLFKELGYPLTGLTFSAAAIQNFLHIYHPEPTSAPIVYFTIRETNSFIDLFYRGKMLFSREIKTGCDSFVESIQSYAATQNLQIDDDTAKSLIFDLFDGRKVYRNPKIDRNLAESIDFNSLPVIDRLIRQLLRTFEYCTTNFKIPAVEMIYTAGTSVLNNEILNSIQQRLGMTCLIVKPFGKEIFNFNAPLHLTPELNILPATGLALSDKKTTKNFLSTYLERARDLTSRKINKIIAYATIGAALSIGVFFAFQHTIITQNRLIVSDLENSLQQKYSLEPRTRSAEQLIPLIAKIKQSHRHYNQSINRFRVLGIIQEITNGMPQEAQLTNISIKLPSTASDTEPTSPSSKKNKAESESISISGIVSAPESKQEFILLTILKKLSGHMLSFKPILESSKVIKSDDSTELSFKIRTSFQYNIFAED